MAHRDHSCLTRGRISRQGSFNASVRSWGSKIFSRLHTNRKPMVQSRGTTAPSPPGSGTMLNSTPRTETCTLTSSRLDTTQRSTGSENVPHRSSCSHSLQRQSSWKPDSEGIPGASRGLYLYHWKLWPSQLIDNASDRMLESKKKYQRSFNKKI